MQDCPDRFVADGGSLAHSATRQLGQLSGVKRRHRMPGDVLPVHHRDDAGLHQHSQVHPDVEGRGPLAACSITGIQRTVSGKK